MRRLALSLILINALAVVLSAQVAGPAQTAQPNANTSYRIARSSSSASPSNPLLASNGEFEAAKIIARIGDEVVLAGDLFGQVNQFLHERIQQVPEAQRALVTPELLQQRRWELMKQLLPQLIDGKLIYLDFLRSIPEERLPEIQDSLYQAFDEQRLPQLVKQAKVETAADLDSLFRSFGSSLEQHRQTFSEQLAAMQWRQRNAKDDSEISHQDLVNYYREHIGDYRISAKCRWEQLSAHDSETFSRENSRKVVAKMGNEVFRGAAFAAVAKRSSNGITASDGGAFDWTTKDSLRSEPINAALFSLPVGYLSKIIEDDLGCHIVRVVERQDESVVPFGEVQGKIREKIREERSQVAVEAYLEKLRVEFPVWTIFDEQ